MMAGKNFVAVRVFLEKNKELLRARFGVRKIGVFGSFVRGEEKEGSDIDILIEFEEGRETFRNYAGLKSFLEDSFGRKVDLVIIETIKPLIKKDILREAVYA